MCEAGRLVSIWPSAALISKTELSCADEMGKERFLRRPVSSPSLSETIH